MTYLPHYQIKSYRVRFLVDILDLGLYNRQHQSGNEVMAKKRKVRKTPRKVRSAYILFAKDTPFRPKVVRKKNAYRRKKTLDISDFV